MSNQHGNFTLNYIETDLNVEVKISCIGYKTFTVTIEFLRKFPKVMLIPDIKVLDEVVISELSPQTILKRAEKNGYKNYKTSSYSADYTLDQLVFYENSDSLIAVSKDSGTLLNRGLDTTGVYPKFRSSIREMSAQFLKYDTLQNQLTSLTKKRNTVPLDLLYSFDPVRVGLLKQFHAVPTMFSKGFYANTMQQILSIVNLDDTEYYLIAVYPRTKDSEHTADTTIQESSEVTHYKKKIRELALQNGRILSERTLDSIFSVKGKVPSFYAMGFFLVNVRNFGISHALIKVSTFDASGKLYAKLHVAGSYIEIGKSYYLQNLDVLMKRTAPFNYKGDETLYYLFSLKLSDFQTKKVRRVITEKPNTRISQQISAELLAQFKLENIRQFLMPVKDCVPCNINPLKYFGQSF